MDITDIDVDELCLMLDNYHDLLDDIKLGGICSANLLAALFLHMVIVKGWFMIIKPEEKRTSRTKNILRKNLALRTIAKEFASENENEQNETENGYIEQLLNFDELFDEYIRVLLKYKGRWLAEYYTSLRYIFNFIDTDSPDEINAEVGYSMMIEYARFGNTYAQRYFSVLHKEKIEPLLFNSIRD